MVGTATWTDAIRAEPRRGQRDGPAPGRQRRRPTSASSTTEPDLVTASFGGRAQRRAIPTAARSSPKLGVPTYLSPSALRGRTATTAATAPATTRSRWTTIYDEITRARRDLRRPGSAARSSSPTCKQRMATAAGDGARRRTCRSPTGSPTPSCPTWPAAAARPASCRAPSASRTSSTTPHDEWPQVSWETRARPRPGRPGARRPAPRPADRRRARRQDRVPRDQPGHQAADRGARASGTSCSTAPT